jgi:hypothetical protein
MKVNREDRIFYVYIHYTADDNVPFYVGKGYADRAYVTKGRNEWWNNIVNKHGYNVEIIHENLTDEEAIKIEIETIAKIGRRDKKEGPLVNLTDGGEGPSGCIISEETRNKLKAAQRGRKHSEETRKKLSNSLKGKPKSEAHRKSISEVQIGRKQSEETKRKRAETLKGVVHKDRGTPMKEEHKKLISKGLSGRKLSEEHKKRLAEAARAAHAKRKLNQ